MCVVGILLLFLQFGRSSSSAATPETVIVVVLAVFTQVTFSIVLALSIIKGARLNDAAISHRFRLSRIETLICDYLVAGETPGLASWGSSGPQASHDSPVQRHLHLTRQVASSLSSALQIESTMLPARVLYMPANFALLSTFWSLSMSGALSAMKSFS